MRSTCPPNRFNINEPNKVATSQVWVLRVPSTSQYPDILMKILPSSLFIDLRSSFNVRNSTPVPTISNALSTPGRGSAPWTPPQAAAPDPAVRGCRLRTPSVPFTINLNKLKQSFKPYNARREEQRFTFRCHYTLILKPCMDRFASHSFSHNFLVVRELVAEENRIKSQANKGVLTMVASFGEEATIGLLGFRQRRYDIVTYGTYSVRFISHKVAQLRDSQLDRVIFLARQLGEGFVEVRKNKPQE
ncbi:hypothetical protein LXL04_018084 [Taraxacum kok-saghyz]